MDVKEEEYLKILAELTRQNSSKLNSYIEHFEIKAQKSYGISVKDLRAIARGISRNHELAIKLWDSGIREARILASMIDDPKQVTPEQMEKWASDFDSWDICDECCINLFIKTPFAYEKAIEWSNSDKEFVKRAGFVLMANLAMHDKISAKTNLQCLLSA